MKTIQKTLILFLIFLAIPTLFSVQAAYLKFDKSSASSANGGTFQISVQVDPSGDTLGSVDVYVNYDATLIKPTAVSSGSQFPTVSNDISTSGKVYIAGMVNDSTASITTVGTLATITFQGLKEGSGTLSFNCDLSETVKNDANGTNTLTCSQNQTATVTIGSGSSTNPTPTTSTVTDTTNDYVPTELPQSGIWDNVVKLAIPGMILLFIGGALKLWPLH